MHTPGPWTVRGWNDLIVGVGEWTLAAYPAPDGASIDEAKANARLIAAAPELLEILSEAVRLSEQGRTMPSDTLRAAKEIVRAAQGERIHLQEPWLMTAIETLSLLAKTAHDHAADLRKSISTSQGAAALISEYRAATGDNWARTHLEDAIVWKSKSLAIRDLKGKGLIR